MTIKVGDKVRYRDEYDKRKDGAICIYVGVVKNTASKTKYVGVVPVGEEAELWWVNDESIDKYLELAEVATYVPVPKFKIGDIVYDKNGKKYLILEEREDDLVYRCWKYAYDGEDVLREEKELTLEEPKEQPKDE